MWTVLIAIYAFTSEQNKNISQGDKRNGHSQSGVQTFSSPASSLSDVRRRLGGAEGIRTPDLRSAIAALSQLSYGPGPPACDAASDVAAIY